MCHTGVTVADGWAGCRVEGLKRVTSAAVGEKHSLCLQCWQIPALDRQGYPVHAEVNANDDLHYSHPHAVPRCVAQGPNQDSDGCILSTSDLCSSSDHCV